MQMETSFFWLYDILYNIWQQLCSNSPPFEKGGRGGIFRPGWIF